MIVMAFAVLFLCVSFGVVVGYVLITQEQNIGD